MKEFYREQFEELVKLITPEMTDEDIRDLIKLDDISKDIKAWVKESKLSEEFKLSKLSVDNFVDNFVDILVKSVSDMKLYENNHETPSKLSYGTPENEDLLTIKDGGYNDANVFINYGIVLTRHCTRYTPLSQWKTNPIVVDVLDRAELFDRLLAHRRRIKIAQDLNRSFNILKEALDMVN